VGGGTQPVQVHRRRPVQPVPLSGRLRGGQELRREPQLLGLVQRQEPHHHRYQRGSRSSQKVLEASVKELAKENNKVFFTATHFWRVIIFHVNKNLKTA